MSLAQVVFGFVPEILTIDFLFFVGVSYACLVKRYFPYRVPSTLGSRTFFSKARTLTMSQITDSSDGQ